MKEVYITTDLYDTSDTSIKMSLKLAKALGLSPKLFFIDKISPQIEETFHAPTVKTNYVDEPIWRDAYEESILQRSSDQLERVGSSKDEVGFKVIEGTITKGLKYLKDNDEVDFITIGPSTHGKVHRFFFNTFAEKFYFNTGKDCFIVKKLEDNFDHICVLINPIADNERLVDKAILLAKKLNSTLHLVSIIPAEFLGANLEAFPDEMDRPESQEHNIAYYHDKTEDYLKRTEERIKFNNIKCGHTLKMIVNKGPAKILNEMISETNSQIVVASPQSHFFDRFSLGSTIQNIIDHSDVNFYLVGATQ